MAYSILLDRLELTNFHKFEQYAIDFDERLTVLVGDNGSGKSSVLEAARLALGAYLVHFPGMTMPRISADDARLALYDSTEGPVLEKQFPVTIAAQGRAGEMGDEEPIAWARSLHSSDDNKVMQEARQLIEKGRACSDRMQQGDPGLVLPILAYYGTHRLWAGSDSRGGYQRRTFSRADGYRGALDARVDGGQLLTWFYKMTAQDVQRAQSLQHQEESPVFGAVRKALEKCFRSIEQCDEVRVTYNFDADDLDVEYRGSDGEIRRLPFSQLSDGYQTTLFMVADIAYRMALLNPASGTHVLETPGIVLIDEIDLHLHPLWQARILNDLRSLFPNIQLVVTTHAPMVIQSVAARHIRQLAEGDHALTPDEEVYGGDVGRILASIMDAPERPRDVQEQIDAFYHSLDAEDFAGAHQSLKQLEELVGSDDVEFVGAQTALALEEAEGHYASD